MKFRQKIVAVVGAMIVGVFAATAVSSPASASVEGPYRFKVHGYNMCLDVTGVSYDNGAYLQLYTCLPNQLNQMFYIYTGVGNRVEIRAAHSGKCLDVEGVSYSVGAHIQQYTCLGPSQTNQQFFRSTDTWEPRKVFQAEHSGLCIDRTDVWDGASVIQGVCQLNLGVSSWDVVAA
jgi:hypothetical protein